MSGPTIQRDGDVWALAWDAHGVGMGFERIKERSDGLKSQVTVESTLAGRVVGPFELNMLSLTAQGTFAKFCAERVNSLSKDMWQSLVVEACAIVIKQYREPTPTLDLSTVPSEGPVEFLVPGLIPLGETTTMYGDGEGGKSLLALRIAFSVALGHELPWGPCPKPGNVLYLDWETNPSTVARRLRRIALGESCAVPAIHYRQCFQSLSDELPNIREEISRKKISLVVVDSIGFAATGALTEDEPARSAMNALRQMHPATRLVVAHVSKATADQAGGRAKPFGSAFFWNGMRSGFEVRRSEESSTDNLIDLGIFHWKSNDTRHVKPFGLSVVFDSEGEGILFERSDIQDVPELAARTPLAVRIRALLGKGSLETQDVAAELGISGDVARVTLSRMEGVRQLNTETGGRGKRALWGLSDDVK